jgi:hypothetical protein
MHGFTQAGRTMSMRQLAAQRRGAGVSYDPAAMALFERFNSYPSALRRSMINDHIVELKDTGIWAKRDCHWLIGLGLDDPGYTTPDDAHAARRNWLADQYNLTPGGAPVFTTDRGYQGDGVAARLATGFNPTLAAGHFSQDSASFSIWSRTAAAAAGTLNFDMAAATNQPVRADLRIHRSDLTTNGALNSAAVNGAGSTDGLGLFSVLRSAAGTVRVRKGKTQIANAANASTGIPNSAFYILGDAGSNYSARQAAAASIGGGLTDAENDALDTALNTWMTAVGAN